MKPTEIYLDLDGVLADWNGSMYEYFGVTEEAMDSEWQPDEKIHHVLTRLLGRKIRSKDIWGHIETDKDFWYNIKPYQYGHRIVDAALALVGKENVFVLTSQAHSRHCFGGKFEFVKSYYPELVDNIFIGKQKEKLAGPGRILVDDTNKKIRKWREAGGIGIHVPRKWNEQHQSFSSPYDYVLDRFEELFGVEIYC